MRQFGTPRGSSPMRPEGCAPTGLKYRSTQTRQGPPAGYSWPSRESAACTSSSICSMMCLDRPYALVMPAPVGASSASGGAFSPYTVQDDEKIRVLHPTLPMTFMRPMHATRLLSKYVIGLSLDSPTALKAAKCTTPRNGLRSKTDFRAASFRRSTSSNSRRSSPAPDSSRIRDRTLTDEFDRLSTIVTLYPAARSCGGGPTRGKVARCIADAPRAPPRAPLPPHLQCRVASDVPGPAGEHDPRCRRAGSHRVACGGRPTSRLRRRCCARVVPGCVR